MSIHHFPAAAAPCDLHIPGKNRLLTLLSADEYGRVAATMEKVTYKRRELLFGTDEPISHAFFPLSAVASLVITMDDGDTVEVGTVGNEGLVGVPLVLDADRSPIEAFTQVEGEYLRMRAEAFREEIQSNGHFAGVMRRYAQAFLAQVSQSTACNRLHPVDQRLCRWILMTHDRVGADQLSLTQEFIAMMLGVRRASVATAAGMLQKAGMIRYQRGMIDILDRKALEEGSCDCYRIVRQEHERLLC
jgi:CRP-like cAMP-binding protein